MDPLADIIQRTDLQKKVEESLGKIVSVITLFSFLGSYVTIIVPDKNPYLVGLLVSSFGKL